MLFSIKEIYHNSEKISQLAQIKVGGWVKSVREGKEKVFITLNDGSTLKSLQLVISQKNFSQTDLLNKVNFGSSLLVSGCLVLTPERQQACELVVERIELVNPSISDLDYQEKKIIPWINSGVLTNLYFLTEYTEPSKYISEKVKMEYKLPEVQPQGVLISDLDLNSEKIVWVSPPPQIGTDVWQLLGTDVWQLLGTDVCANATLFFALRQVNFSRYASGSIINHLQRSVLVKLQIDWVNNPSMQKYFLTLLNSPLAKIKNLHSKIKNLHSKIKNLLLRKYFG